METSEFDITNKKKEIFNLNNNEYINLAKDCLNYLKFLNLDTIFLMSMSEIDAIVLDDNRDLNYNQFLSNLSNFFTKNFITKNQNFKSDPELFNLYLLILKSIELIQTNLLEKKLKSELIDIESLNYVTFLILFNTNCIFLQFSATFIQNIIKVAFETVTNNIDKNHFFSFFTKDRIEQAIKAANLENNNQADLISVLFFINCYETGIAKIKEKLTNQLSSNKTVEIFNNFAYFQSEILSNFFLSRLLQYLKAKTTTNNNSKIYKADNSIILKLSNMIIINQAQIARLDSNIYSTKNCLNSYKDLAQFENLIKKIFKNNFIRKDLYNLWYKYYTINPIKVSILTIKKLFGLNTNDNIYLSYKSIEKVIQNLNAMNNKDFSIIIVNLKVLINSLSIVNIMFNLDLSKYYEIIENRDRKVYDYFLKWNQAVITSLNLIKITFHKSIYYYIKDLIENIVKDILSREATVYYIMNNIFEKDLIDFVLNNLDFDRIRAKDITESLILSKNSGLIINGINLLAVWTNKQPSKENFSILKDFLFVLTKVIDIKPVLQNKNDFIELIKAVYLLSRSFPKICEEILQFLNFINTKLNETINTNTTSTDLLKLLNNAKNFISKLIIETCYQNQNTLYINYINNNKI